MKRNFWIILLAILTFGLSSCDDDDSDNGIVNKSETISQGASFTNDVYYSLNNGVVAEVPRTNWDIAFSVGAMSSSILINDGAGVELKVYPTDAGWQWTDAIDTTGYSSWDALINSDESWEEGAFGQNATDHPNYGWGEYDMASHNVIGVAMYIIKLIDGQYKRIFIELKDASNQEYKFKYSDLDGTNEVTETLSFANETSNFIYYSMTNEVEMDNREPDASTWDLLFTSYMDNTIHYNVSGVKQNIGVLAIEKDNVETLTIETYNETAFTENITTLGYDWKDFDMGTFQYTIDPDRVYFVKDKNDKVYKIVFTAFGGSATGDIGFDITAL